GRATLAVYSQRNNARDTPASYLRKNLQSSRADLDYERVTPEFFAIAAVMGDSIYYSRCNFSSNGGGAIHCFDMKYPVQERQSWDGIFTRLSVPLRPLRGGWRGMNSGPPRHCTNLRSFPRKREPRGEKLSQRAGSPPPRARTEIKRD